MCKQENSANSKRHQNCETVSQSNGACAAQGLIRIHFRRQIESSGQDSAPQEGALFQQLCIVLTAFPWNGVSFAGEIPTPKQRQICLKVPPNQIDGLIYRMFSIEVAIMECLSFVEYSHFETIPHQPSIAQRVRVTQHSYHNNHCLWPEGRVRNVTQKQKPPRCVPRSTWSLGNSPERIRKYFLMQIDIQGITRP